MKATLPTAISRINRRPWDVVKSNPDTMLVFAMALCQLLIVLGSIGALLQPVPDGSSRVRVVRRLFTRVEVLGVRPQGTVTLGGGTIEAAVTDRSKAFFSMEFPMGREPRVTGLEVAIAPLTVSGGRLRFEVTTTARVQDPGGTSREMRRVRSADIVDGTTFVHQVYEYPRREESIVCVMTAETRDIPELIRAESGLPVVFRVVLVRETSSGVVPVDENLLRTLEGSAVSYTFASTSGGGSGFGSTPPSSVAGVPAAIDPPRSEPTLDSTEPREATGGAHEPASPSRTAPPPEGARKAEPTFVERNARPATIITARKGAAGSVRGGTGGDAKEPADGGSASAGGTQPASSGGTQAADDRPRSSDSGVRSPDGRSRSEQTGDGAPDGPRTGWIGPAVPFQDLEITLLPSRATDGILIVDTIISARYARPGESTDRAILTRRTQAVTSGGSFELKVGEGGAGDGAAYRFIVRSEF